MGVKYLLYDSKLFFEILRIVFLKTFNVYVKMRIFLLKDKTNHLILYMMYDVCCAVC